MAVYMHVEGITPSDELPIEALKALESSGWFQIDNFSWGAMRSINMTLGNSYNNDSGMAIMNQISASKKMTGASEYLISMLFVPGKEGRKVTIAFTKNDNDGTGERIYFTVILEKARICSYNIHSEGNEPHENFAFTYSMYTQEFITEEEGGTTGAGDKIIFDLTKNEATSVKSK